MNPYVWLAAVLVAIGLYGGGYWHGGRQARNAMAAEVLAEKVQWEKDSDDLVKEILERASESLSRQQREQSRREANARSIVGRVRDQLPQIVAAECRWPDDIVRDLNALTGPADVPDPGREPGAMPREGLLTRIRERLGQSGSAGASGADLRNVPQPAR